MESPVLISSLEDPWALNLGAIHLRPLQKSCFQRLAPDFFHIPGPHFSLGSALVPLATVYNVSWLTASSKMSPCDGPLTNFSF